MEALLSDQATTSTMTIPAKPKTLTEMVFDIQAAQEAVAYAQQDVDDANGRLSTARMALDQAVEAAEPLRVLFEGQKVDVPAKRGRGRPATAAGAGFTDFLLSCVAVGQTFKCGDISRAWTKKSGARSNVWAMVGNNDRFKKIDSGTYSRIY